MLADLAAKHGTDKLVHGYCPWYERHLGDVRKRPLTLLEIGVERGASLRMWEDWLPNATIIGVDIDPAETVTTERITTVVSDIKAYNPPAQLDVVVDDGSHHADDIVGAWKLLWPHVAAGGWYVIEDLSTQFISEWGGTATGSWATNWLIQGVVHDVLRQLIGETGDVAEVHIYPRLVFIQRGMPR